LVSPWESRQERVNRSLDALNAFDLYEGDLIQLGWDAQEAKQLTQNLKCSINQAATVRSLFEPP
jgi:hypothetical protein